MSRHVRITLKRKGMEVLMNRRTRQSFRDKVTDELGGVWRGDSFVQEMSTDDVDGFQRLLAEAYPEWQVEIEDERPKRLRPQDNVLWATMRGTHGSQTVKGFVGDIELFSVTSRYTRGGDEYFLHTSLPGYNSGPFTGCTKVPLTSLREAQAYAERVLVRFLARLNAELKGQI